jgi:hypothetical protein
LKAIKKNSAYLIKRVITFWIVVFFTAGKVFIVSLKYKGICAVSALLDEAEQNRQ